MPYSANLGPDQCWGCDDGGYCAGCGEHVDGRCSCERCERCDEICEGEAAVCRCPRCDQCGTLMDEFNDTGLCAKCAPPDDCTAAVIEAETAEAAR